jgi:hypothetical protein
MSLFLTAHSWRSAMAFPSPQPLAYRQRIGNVIALRLH